MMAFEDVLQDIAGNGKFLRNFKYLFVIPISLVVPWFWMSILYMLSVPDHWCNVPVVRSSNLSILAQRSIISPPEDPSCTMYDVDYQVLLNEGNFTYPNDSKVIACKDGWQYDDQNYDSTLATKWDMVCDKRYYPSLVLTLQKVGNFIGTPILGLLSDKIGRRTILFVVAIVVAVGETISIFLNNFVVFSVVRVITSTVLSTAMSLLSIFCVELVPPEKRVHLIGTINVTWTIGLSIQPLIAYLSRNWIGMALSNALAGIFVLSYWRFLPESPCWLVSQGRYEEAVKILKRIGDKNGKNPDEAVLLKKLQALGEDISKKKDEETHSRFNLFKYPRLRKHFLIVTFSWVANGAAYGGFLYNVRNLYGNEFINYFLLAIVEVPGNIAFAVLMNRCGRRWTSTFGFFVTGIICLAPVTGLPYTEIMCSMVGKFVASGNYMVTDQQASELYPTVSRTFGIGASKTIATALTICLPYIADLSVYGKEIPFVFVTIICLIAGVIVSFLPETLNENLPQTTTEAEEFGKDQKYFSWRRRKPSPRNDSTPTD